MSSKTMVVKQSQVRHDWFVVDAQGTPVGRVAARAAKILMGKNKAAWSPSLDNGDFVVVVNAGKAVLTGRKEQDKMYRRHTGFPGGLRETNAADMRAKHPEKLIEEAVRGMLPKNSLGRKQFKKLKVYGGATHPHEAQRPKTLKLAARA
ncbi:MAG TPA: 50S ribosomal protein L13 [Thermoanaerobaculia bacterium]|jgi:large subunit ribosomal protein L13|nr:50S ribosomal protein L13 [Thermoanaerobaculia bacterium]